MYEKFEKFIFKLVWRETLFQKLFHNFFIYSLYMVISKILREILKLNKIK